MQDHGYTFLDGLATADVAFRAWGRTLTETFAEAARATLRVMVENLEGVGVRVTRTVHLQASSAEFLLFDFLGEIIFYKDAQRLLLLPQSLQVGQDGRGVRLVATLGGEEIDPQRHLLLVDVKAVTMYRFSLACTEEGWTAEVVLDI